MVLDRTIHIGFPNVTGMTDITSDIEAGSVTLSEVLFARFAFGSYSAGKMEFIMYNLTDVAEEKLHVWITNSNNVVTDVFTGYVESCKLDNLGHFRKVVAYDEMYWKRDTDVSQWWNTFWASRTTATLAEIRGSLCTYVGFTQVSGTHFNDNLSIKKKNEIGMIRFSDILTYLCELQCTFPNMARDGRIEFVSLDPAKVATHSGVALEQAQCAFEDFTTAAISQIVVTLDNEVVYRTATNDRSVYSIQNNIFLYDYANTEIKTFADAFLTEAAKITYVPATLTLVCSDLSVKLGDIITTSHGNCRVFQNDLSGALLVNQEVRATGEKTLAQVRGSYDVTYANLSQRVANTVDELHTNYMTAETINATFVAADDLEADVVTAGFIKASEVDSNYARINLANVNNAWIQNGAIKDAAIGDAQIAGVSANKLTAGTIDASNITVTNLNASNISAGSLSVGGVTIDVGNGTAAVNGSAITSGSIPLSGLSSEVVDKIEGAIETFTTNAVPTLNNYPASSWTTSAQKDEHVGDICYVVNSASSADGYCYRFTESNGVYSWVLIKDSDVTSALQNIIELQGDVSALESFETETATWKTEAEGEITSLMSRTTSLEANALKGNEQLWYTASDKVESVSAEIEYKQNLHGYDYPWVAGGGKNKSDAGAFETGVVNTDGTIVKGNTTINSQGNGEVEWTSTATWRGITSDYIPVKANTSYRISLTETPSYVLYAWYQADKTFISRASYNASNPVSITSPSNGAYVRFTLQESAIGSYDYHNIQFEEGSSATAYAPYENICPIEGHNEANISVEDDFHQGETYTTQFSFEGQNIFTRVGETENKYLNSNGAEANSNYYCITDYLEVEPLKRYVFDRIDYSVIGRAVYHAYYDENKTLIRVSPACQEFHIPPTGTKYVRLSFRKNYAPDSVHIELGTVYEGTLDVKTGVLTVTHGFISDLSHYTYALASTTYPYIFTADYMSNGRNSQTSSDRNKGFVCSGYKASANTSVSANFNPYSCLFVGTTVVLAGNGRFYFRNDDYTGDATAFRASMAEIQAVYPFDEPCVYQLTPTEVKTLLGANNISANTGKVEVTLPDGRTFSDYVVSFNSYPQKPNSIVNDNTDAPNGWKTIVPTYDEDYPRYFYCLQQIKADNTATWTDVVYDAEGTETRAVVNTKVDTSTFNTLSQTVDENTASITQLSQTVATKADSSTVTTLSQTVNTVQQTANTNRATISTLTTVLGTNADGSTKTGDVMHRMTTAESNITQNAHDITLKVSESDVTGDYVVGKINLNSTSATIEARHINLVGAVSANAIQSGAVTADKINVSDLEALNATIAGWSIGQNAISKTIQNGNETQTAYLSTGNYYALGCESSEQGYARVTYDGKIELESALDRNEGRLMIRNVSEHYAGETYADGGYVVCREPYDSTQYPELKIASQLDKGFVRAEYKEFYSAPDFPQTSAYAEMAAPHDASGNPYVVVRKDIDESALSKKSDVAQLLPTSLTLHSDDNPVSIELLGTSAGITLNGNNVLTDAIIPTTIDSGWTNDTSNDTSLHYTNVYMTIPADGMYAIAAEAEYVASAPQELAVITWSQSIGTQSIEQICRQENASLYTSKFLHCGTTADLKGGYIIQIYVRYNGTGTNRVRLRIRKLL